MRLSKPLFWLIAFLWLIAGTWWYSCSECSSCATQPTVSAVKSLMPGFNVSDGTWHLSSDDNLRFGKSGALPVLGAKMNGLFDSLAMYLTTHPDKSTQIIGHYTSEEVNPTQFGNLGLARAEEIKQILVRRGLPENRLTTGSQLDGSLVFNPADTLLGGISMLMNTMAPKVKEDLFEPRTVYFNSGQNTLPTDAAFADYLSKANDYLANHANKNLIVTGHTDNVGAPDMNMKLSASRAAFIKSELVKRGVTAARIQSSGKGMNEPAESNDTEAGKSKNRRVVIQLQ